MSTELVLCEVCGERPPWSGDETCMVCEQLIHIEVAKGLYLLTAYLKAWLGFRVYEENHASNL